MSTPASLSAPVSSLGGINLILPCFKKKKKKKKKKKFFFFVQYCAIYNNKHRSSTLVSH
ncbi:hypothetical protein [Microbacterium aurum]